MIVAAFSDGRNGWGIVLLRMEESSLIGDVTVVKHCLDMVLERGFGSWYGKPR